MGSWWRSRIPQNRQLCQIVYRTRVRFTVLLKLDSILRFENQSNDKSFFSSNYYFDIFSNKSNSFLIWKFSFFILPSLKWINEFDRWFELLKHFFYIFQKIFHKFCKLYCDIMWSFSISYPFTWLKLFPFSVTWLNGIDISILSQSDLSTEDKRVAVGIWKAIYDCRNETDFSLKTASEIISDYKVLRTDVAPELVRIMKNFIKKHYFSWEFFLDSIQFWKKIWIRNLWTSVGFNTEYCEANYFNGSQWPEHCHVWKPWARRNSNIYPSHEVQKP